MQTISWDQYVEVAVMAVTLIVGAISIFYIWKQTADTDGSVEAAEKSAELMESSRTNAEQALDQSRSQIDQAREQIEATFRPNVFVATESPKSDGGRKIYLIVQNIGTRTAYNVRLIFTPELVTCDEHYKLDHLHWLVDRIPSLAPGTRVGHAFDHVMSIRQTENEPPEEYTVSIAFSDGQGKGFSFEQKLSMRFYTSRSKVWRFIERIEEGIVSPDQKAV